MEEAANRMEICRVSDPASHTSGCLFTCCYRGNMIQAAVGEQSLAFRWVSCHNFHKTGSREMSFKIKTWMKGNWWGFGSDSATMRSSVEHFALFQLCSQLCIFSISPYSTHIWSAFILRSELDPDNQVFAAKDGKSEFLGFAGPAESPAVTICSLFPLLSCKQLPDSCRCDWFHVFCHNNLTHDGIRLNTDDTHTGSLCNPAKSVSSALKDETFK